MTIGVQDLTGSRFGRLVAVRSATFNRQNRKQYGWLCRCDCGVEKVVRSGCLKAGSIRSCGCLVIDTNSTHGMTNTPTFVSWQSMKNRCLNPNADSFPNYGARGVSICARWIESFENFLADMGERPADRTLDRINVNGNYEPKNCRWATAKEQRANQRPAMRAKKLNAETAMDIYLSSSSTKDIATQHGLSTSLVLQIKRRVAWKHIHSNGEVQ